MPYERDSSLLERHIGIWMMGLTLPASIMWMGIQRLVPLVIARIPPEWTHEFVKANLV